VYGRPQRFLCRGCLCSRKVPYPDPGLSAGEKEVMPVSWICEECSSNNDDDSMECFVCGAHRSRASLREAARRKREQRRDAVGAVLCTKVFTGLKIAALSAAALLVIGLILCVVTGRALLPTEQTASFRECLADRAAARMAAVPDLLARLRRPHLSGQTTKTFGRRAATRLRSLFSAPDGKKEDPSVLSVMKTAAGDRAEKIRTRFRVLSGRVTDGWRKCRAILRRLTEAVRDRVVQWNATVREAVSRIRARIGRTEKASAAMLPMQFIY